MKSKDRAGRVGSIELLGSRAIQNLSPLGVPVDAIRGSRLCVSLPPGIGAINRGYLTAASDEIAALADAHGSEGVRLQNDFLAPTAVAGPFAGMPHADWGHARAQQTPCVLSLGLC